MAKVARAFDIAGIRYAVIGGQAVIQHGYARTTIDVDFTLSAGLDRHVEVVAVLNAIGLTSRFPQDEDTIRLRQLFVADDENLGVQADFSFVDSPYLDIALQRAVSYSIEGYPVRFLCLEDLIIHKLIAGRPQDHADIVELLLINPAFDSEEIRRWLIEFEPLVETPLLDRFEQLCREAEP